jgi:hypothetical protein
VRREESEDVDDLPTVPELWTVCRQRLLRMRGGRIGSLSIRTPRVPPDVACDAG